MSSWKKLVPVKRRPGNEKLLYVEDLAGRKEVAVEISNITPGEMATEDGTKSTGLIEFWDNRTGKPREKRLAINGTMRDVLGTLFGPNFWEAVGWIVLYSTTTEIYDRKLRVKVKKDCIRIRTQRPDPRRYPASFDYAENVKRRTELAIANGWHTAKAIAPIETIDVTEPPPDEAADAVEVERNFTPEFADDTDEPAIPEDPPSKKRGKT
jgi:hypothetical protein